MPVITSLGPRAHHGQHGQQGHGWLPASQRPRQLFTLSLAVQLLQRTQTVRKIKLELVCTEEFLTLILFFSKNQSELLVETLRSCQNT